MRKVNCAPLPGPLSHLVSHSLVQAWFPHPSDQLDRLIQHKYSDQCDGDDDDDQV